MKEQKVVVTNPYGQRISMDVCPYPEKHCVWCMWIEDRWLCDCREIVKKLKHCCDCSNNNCWEKGTEATKVCLRCGLEVTSPVSPSDFLRNMAFLKDGEKRTIEKWKRDA